MVRMRAVALALVLSLSACASLRRAEETVLAADPAPGVGFAEPLVARGDHAAFDRMWVSPARDWRSYPKLYVAVVDVSHTIEPSWWDELNIRTSQVDHDLVVAAARLRSELVTAFREDPLHHFTVVDDPTQVDAETAQLEVALVELVPNKAVLGAIGLVAWGAPLEIGIPVATATAFIAHGATAIEARVRDGGSGEVIATFGDRSTGRMRVLDLRSLSWYGNAYEDFGDWAETFVALANAEHPEKVRHPSYFTLMPW